MPLAYKEDGSFGGVPDDYQPQAGEVLFSDHATDDQLEVAFPGYKAVKTANLIKSRLAVLENALHDYVYSRYDQGTQSSLTALFVLPTTSDAAKTAIAAMWVWMQTVIARYYQLRDQIKEGDMVEVNFIPFDLTDPKVRLENLMGA